MLLESTMQLGLRWVFCFLPVFRWVYSKNPPVFWYVPGYPNPVINTIHRLLFMQNYQLSIKYAPINTQYTGTIYSNEANFRPTLYIKFCWRVPVTLSNAAVLNGYTSKCSGPYWSIPAFIIFCHLCTQVLRTEQQRARMSEK